MEKKVLKRIAVILILISSSFTNLVKAQKSIDSLVNTYLKSHKIPGAVIGVLENNRSIKLRSFGLANIQNNSAVNNATSFELGSLTKQFTATAILKLQQDKKLHIEDYVYEYFPECPKHWKEIKIKHLIWHTSGLPGMYPHDSFKEKSFTGYAKMSSATLDLMMQTNTVTKELSTQSIISDALDFKPGSKYNYSDVGYLVLGIIIDNITGNYKNYMENHIFSVADLKNTYVLEQSKVVINQARGYSLKNGALINIMRTWDYEIPSFFGIFSTVEDLIKWNQVLDTDLLLNKQQRSFLFSKGTLNNGMPIAYGGGWEINNINGIDFISHNGVTGTRMLKIPSLGFCLVLLTNLGYNGNDFVDPWSLSSELLAFYGIEHKINKKHITSDGQKVIKFNPKQLKNIEGLYTSIDNIKATISIEKGIPFFENQGAKNELALLENGSWLVLGLEYEYILSYHKDNRTLRSNLGRVFTKK